MKKITGFMLLLAVFLAACTPGIPESGVSTAIVITAEVSTVMPETPAHLPPQGLRLRLYPRR